MVKIDDLIVGAEQEYQLAAKYQKEANCMPDMQDEHKMNLALYHVSCANYLLNKKLYETFSQKMYD